MISLRKVHVRAQDQVLLHEVSLELTGAQMVGVYGPNGSGKTSLLKVIAGETVGREVSGENWIDERPIFHGALSAQEKAQKILYLGSDFHAPFQVTVRELLELAKSSNPGSKANLAEVAENFGIYPLLSRSFEQMSDGEKQRVMIVRGVIQSPQWLILDETFSKIDLDQSFHLARELKAQAAKGMGIVFSSHDLNLVSEMADQLWLMKRGRIISQGAVEEVLTTENLQELFPGRLVHVVRSPDSGKKKVIY